MKAWAVLVRADPDRRNLSDVTFDGMNAPARRFWSKQGFTRIGKSKEMIKAINATTE
jgi:hypothetical protein